MARLIRTFRGGLVPGDSAAAGGGAASAAAPAGPRLAWSKKPGIRHRNGVDGLNPRGERSPSARRPPGVIDGHVGPGVSWGPTEPRSPSSGVRDLARQGEWRRVHGSTSPPPKGRCSRPMATRSSSPAKSRTGRGSGHRPGQRQAAPVAAARAGLEYVGASSFSPDGRPCSRPESTDSRRERRGGRDRDLDLAPAAVKRLIADGPGRSTPPTTRGSPACASRQATGSTTSSSSTRMLAAAAADPHPAPGRAVPELGSLRRANRLRPLPARPSRMGQLDLQINANGSCEDRGPRREAAGDLLRDRLGSPARPRGGADRLLGEHSPRNDENPRKCRGFRPIAGAGFEPATFGL